MKTPVTPQERARFVFDHIPTDGLFAGGHGKVSWRVSPEAFPLTAEFVSKFEALGAQLLKFYRAANLLYRQSWQGKAPAFVAEYLDAGKPDSLVQFSRMNRIKQDLPRVIRPDILLLDTETATQPLSPTSATFAITELDSVPGGMGLTGSLSEIYAQLTDAIVGGAMGMVQQLAAMFRGLTENQQPHVAIVISDESAAYRPEMKWLGERLNDLGLSTIVLAPEDLRITEVGVFDPQQRRVNIVYRFFELFDLDNVPHAVELMNAVKKGSVAVIPTFKPYLEEKMLFALFQHPALQTWWNRELGDETFAALHAVFPRSWIFDARPLPPHAVIPDLQIGGQAVTSWEQLKNATQRERELILKVSGFHPNAWGARGVVMGRDLPASDWSAAIDQALADFPKTQHILQRFVKSQLVESTWFDFEKNELQPMRGRVRLCPYYFVTRLPSDNEAGEVKMGGVLATICPPDKKLLHGMTDAIMCPCRIESEHA